MTPPKEEQATGAWVLPEKEWAAKLYQFLLGEFSIDDPSFGEIVSADVRPHFEALCKFLAAAPHTGERELLESAYTQMLQLPMGAVRMTIQKALCSVRDALAILRSETPQETQEYFETLVLKSPAPTGEGRGKSQGQCATTMTERFANPLCRCDTYEGNLGPCAEFTLDDNGRCVYCDHERNCHEAVNVLAAHF